MGSVRGRCRQPQGQARWRSTTMPRAEPSACRSGRAGSLCLSTSRLCRSSAFGMGSSVCALLQPTVTVRAGLGAGGSALVPSQRAVAGSRWVYEQGLEELCESPFSHLFLVLHKMQTVSLHGNGDLRSKCCVLCWGTSCLAVNLLPTT